MVTPFRESELTAYTQYVSASLCSAIIIQRTADFVNGTPAECFFVFFSGKSCGVLAKILTFVRKYDTLRGKVFLGKEVLS